MTDGPSRAHPGPVTAVAVMVVLVGLLGLTIAPWHPLVKPLAWVLVLCAVAAELIAARYMADLTVSAAFVAAMLAVGFLGPVAAFLIPAISYTAVWVVDRYRWRALIINLAGSATPSMAA